MLRVRRDFRTKAPYEFAAAVTLAAAASSCSRLAIGNNEARNVSNWSQTLDISAVCRSITSMSNLAAARRESRRFRSSKASNPRSWLKCGRGHALEPTAVVRSQPSVIRERFPLQSLASWRPQSIRHQLCRSRPPLAFSMPRLCRPGFQDLGMSAVGAA